MRNTDFEATQAIGAAVFAASFEGLLVISATRLGHNLILFPDHLRVTSQVTLISSRDPRPYVERS